MQPNPMEFQVDPAQSFIREENESIIMARFNKAKSYVQPWHDGIKNRRRLYDLDHFNEPAKPHEQQYPDPTPTNTVDLAVGIILANDMVWKAYGFEPSPEEEDMTSNVEKYLAGTLEINSEREQVHIPYQVALHLVRDGSAIMYSWWDQKKHNNFMSVTQIMDEESEQGVRPVAVFTETPMCMKVIDPLEVFVLPGGDRERWLHVFRETDMTVYDVEQLYNISLPDFVGLSEQMKMETKGRFVDYWRYANLGQPGGIDKTVVLNACFFNTRFIPGFQLRVMEGYEDLPYTFGFYKPVDVNKPAGWGHSVVDVLEGSVRLLEDSINRRMRQITVYSALPMVIKTQNGRQVQVDPGFGSPVIIDVAEDVGFPVWPGNAPDVDKHIEFLRSRIQQSGFSDIMFGSGPSQVSGYALSQMGDQNRIRMEQPIAHLEMFWTTWARKTLRLTKSFASNALVRVYGRMRGQDFAEQVMGGTAADFMVKCEIVPDFPNDKTRKVAMATQAAPFLSKRTIMEQYLGIQQPDDERERQLIEQAEEHPTMKMYGLILALQELAESDDKKKAKAATMALEQLQSQTNPGSENPQGGNPSTGPRQQQMSGMASPTGQPTQQERGMPPVGQSPMDEMRNAATAAVGMSGEVA
jgi:hypothetical protein